MKFIFCFLGLHDWHKYRFRTGMMIQSYGRKQCERCGFLAIGYARKNHPFFRKSLGMYSDN